MLNKVMIIGRLGRDPELRYSQAGAPVCTLNIATDESYKDQQGQRVERTEWHRVIVFQRAAENCKNFLRKGSLVYVEGNLQTRKWQDQNGQDRYSTEIRAQRVQFLDRRDAQGDGAYGGGYPSAPQPGAPQSGARQIDEPPFYQQGNGGPAANYQAQPQELNQPAPAFPPQQGSAPDDGPVFPSEAQQMDDVPF
ncbi:MAG: single-stranded DNA-binding protein [Desulfovibrionaceae bacterium]|nr:single-stranded DNA-binding protein [Desulfovibrionaceae bacterium]